MSKNIKLNDTNYNAVSTVQLPTADGGTASFKDVDEITTPSGSVTITENGTHDVTNYESAVVNVSTSEGTASENSYEMGQFEITEVTLNYTYKHSLGRVPKFALLYPISIAKDGNHTAYAISTQYQMKGLGQSDYSIADKESEVWENDIFGAYHGVGYATTVTGGNVNAVSTQAQRLEMTEEHVVFGQMVESTVSSGHLTVGTYGVIVG